MQLEKPRLIFMMSLEGPPMKTPIPLTLHRITANNLHDDPAHMGWSALAAALPATENQPVITAAFVAATAAIQRAGADLLQAYDANQPERRERITLGCSDRGLSSSFLDTAAQDWTCGAGLDPIGKILLLGAQADNEALGMMDAALGLTNLRRDGVGLKALDVLRATEREIPVPETFSESATSALGRPALESPESLDGQLEWMLNHWEPYLSSKSRDLVFLARDLLAEETQVRIGGPGPVQPPAIGNESGFLWGGRPGAPGFVDGQASFSEDAHWMPKLVMIAKQTFVWLDQLSKAYDKPINRLDEIPDSELDRLASQGFGGLWLIGLWERSGASRDIKVRRGNPEAEASAYALRDYAISDRLGGEDALKSLKERAWQRGIRLAADMVPNHMGLDSRWMAEHPDWFLQLPTPPYPGYTFDGPDLSSDDRFGVYLEDGYWNESDAAVVFKRVDNQSGEVRYVYHGNDGTQMPWNDTAQLDYLKPYVREAVIQTILGVARQFPVIRFDAAMTLARKHISRLWYPPPGGGGAIPSRAENSVSQEVFDELVPGEFWREVVERVQEEVPDTLLLAEAFWMMEGYFVRTLGMHRVYNSAFMHMLRDEDNAGYRGAIKQVLEYSPAILERYVNFMNNPDEETAVEQFGKGDKYFGIATLMATLPGLPMFGHGQLEGYAEKYGMEYSKAYWDESPDQGLIDHHERIIFPLLRDRHLFCGVDRFALLDFYRDGEVDENVFAYANQAASGHGKSLVLYNNSMIETGGWVKTSTAINVGESDAPELIQRSLAETLDLKDDDDVYYGLWELRRKSWLLRSGADLVKNGIFATLNGYEALVFMDFKELRDIDGRVARLERELDGGWVEDLEAALTQTVKSSTLDDIDEDALDTVEEKLRSPKDSAFSVPIAAQEKLNWEVIPSPNRLSRSYDFENSEILKIFLKEALDYQDSVQHHGKFIVEHHKITIEIYTHDLDDITEVDFEWANMMDNIYKDEESLT